MALSVDHRHEERPVVAPAQREWQRLSVIAARAALVTAERAITDVRRSGSHALDRVQLRIHAWALSLDPDAQEQADRARRIAHDDALWMDPPRS